MLRTSDVRAAGDHPVNERHPGVAACSTSASPRIPLATSSSRCRASDDAEGIAERDPRQASSGHENTALMFGASDAQSCRRRAFGSRHRRHRAKGSLSTDTCHGSRSHFRAFSSALQMPTHIRAVRGNGMTTLNERRDDNGVIQRAAPITLTRYSRSPFTVHLCPPPPTSLDTSPTSLPTYPRR